MYSIMYHIATNIDRIGRLFKRVGKSKLVDFNLISTPLICGRLITNANLSYKWVHINIVILLITDCWEELSRDCEIGNLTDMYMVEVEILGRAMTPLYMYFVCDFSEVVVS